MALQGHIVIPTTHEHAQDIINDVTTLLAIEFGGYSRYDGAGGWEDNTGINREDHVRLVVNTNDMGREQLTEHLRIEAEYVKEELDEDAVLIEVHEMDMELV